MAQKHVYVNIKDEIKWNNELERTNKKASTLVTELVNDYLEGYLLKIDLPLEIKEKFSKCTDKNFLIKKLLIDYYNDNIINIEEYLKAAKILGANPLIDRVANINHSTNTSIENFTQISDNEEEISKDIVNNEIIEEKREVKNTVLATTDESKYISEEVLTTLDENKEDITLVEDKIVEETKSEPIQEKNITNDDDSDDDMASIFTSGIML